MEEKCAPLMRTSKKGYESESDAGKKPQPRYDAGAHPSTSNFGTPTFIFGTPAGTHRSILEFHRSISELTGQFRNPTEWFAGWGGGKTPPPL